jgi:hypothetical protein
MHVDRNLWSYQSGLEEGATLSSFVLRLAEVAGDGHADRITEFITDALNKMHLPAIILDRQAIVTATTSMAHTTAPWRNRARPVLARPIPSPAATALRLEIESWSRDFRNSPQVIS